MGGSEGEAEEADDGEKGVHDEGHGCGVTESESMSTSDR